MIFPESVGFRRRAHIGPAKKRCYIIMTIDEHGKPMVHKTMPHENRVGERPGTRVISPEEAQDLKRVILEMLGSW